LEDRQEEIKMADWREESSIQYKVLYDKASGVFSILDLWDDSVRNLPPDATIPEDSPGLKKISSLEVNALLGKLDEMGWIEKLFGKSSGATSSSFSSKPSTMELAIEKIENITCNTAKDIGVDSEVAREAITSIRELLKETYR
jgi:hypothetical protein